MSTVDTLLDSDSGRLQGMVVQVVFLRILTGSLLGTSNIDVGPREAGFRSNRYLIIKSS